MNELLERAIKKNRKSIDRVISMRKKFEKKRRKIIPDLDKAREILNTIDEKYGYIFEMKF